MAIAVVLLILGSVFLRNPDHLADEGVPTGAVNTGNELMARLLDLNPGVWERFSPEQRIKHLRDTIRKYETLPTGQRGGKFPALYYLIATLLNEAGQPAEALDFLNRVENTAGTEDWLHYSKGVTLENLGEPSDAIEEYLHSLSYKMAPQVGARLAMLSRSQGVDPARHWSRLRELMASRAKPFEPFSLKTPQGKPRTLSDFQNQVTLVGFYFPG